jgi:hypothetical protein
MWRSPTHPVHRMPSTAIALITGFALSRRLDKTLNESAIRVEWSAGVIRRSRAAGAKLPAGTLALLIGILVFAQSCIWPRSLLIPR